MASLNTSSNGPNITRSYQNVVNSPPPSGAQASSPTYGQWAVFAVAAPLVSAFQSDGGKESVLKVQSTGGMCNQHPEIGCLHCSDSEPLPEVLYTTSRRCRTHSWAEMLEVGNSEAQCLGEQEADPTQREN